jgi:hypothetical protein
VTYDAVISYAASEAARAERLADALERTGLSVWLDRLTRRVGDKGPQEGMVPPGSEHWQVISDAIDRSATLVVLDSPAWRGRSYCRREFEHALTCGKRVIVLGTGGGDQLQAACGLGAHDLEGAAGAISEGLEVSSAHARMTLAAHSPEKPRRWWGTAGRPSDAKLIAGADLGRLGITLTSDVQGCLERTLKQHARNRRAAAALTACIVAVLGVLAVLTILAAGAAQRGRDRATSAERHVQALAAAAASEATANTTGRLQTAETAVRLEQDPTTLGALRDALTSMSEGVTATGLPQVQPAGIAVANDGRTVAEVLATGSLVLTDVTGGAPPRVLGADLDAGGAPEFSPDGSRVAFLRRDDGAAEVVDVSNGRAQRLRGSSDLVDVMLLSATEAIGVERSGEVLRFNSEKPQRAAKTLGSVPGPVRAAAFAGRSATGALSLATLDDAMTLRVGPLAARPELAVQLHVTPGPYILGWESIHVCDGNLSVLTTDMVDSAGPAFAIPYTVTAGGRATPTGSLIHSFGLVCLPGGGALASDPIAGQESFPVAGSAIVGFTRPPSERLEYAIASSENDEWAAAAGSDGSLRIVDLHAVGRSVKLASAVLVAPADPPVVVARNGTLESVGAGGTVAKVTSVAGSGGAVRGSYLDPAAGTVVANGRELLVYRSGRVVRRAALPGAIDTIRHGERGQSAVVLLRDGRVLLVSLAGPPSEISVRLPLDLLEHSGAPTDALMLDARELAVASTNGSVDLLAYPGGEEIRHRQVSAPGALTLATGGRGLVLGEQNGAVEVLNDDLAMLDSRKVLAAGVIDLEPNANGRLIAAQSGSEVVVLAIPALFAVAHTGVIGGLGSVTFAPAGGSFLLSTDITFTGGGDESSIISWPLCSICSGTPRQLRAAAAALVRPRLNGLAQRFAPVGR